VIVQLEYALTVISNVTEHVRTQSTQILLPVALQGGIVLGIQTRQLVTARVKCISLKFT